MKDLIKEHVEVVKKFCKAEPFTAIAACLCFIAVVVFIA